MKRDRGGQRRGVAKLAVAAAMAALVTLPIGAGAASRTFTVNADFASGVLDGVNDSAVADQLQLNVTGTTFPVMWVANAGEDTVSKFDTTNNRELARYRTWFGPAGQAGHSPHPGNAYAGAAPSRTCVDNDGNVYVANRQFEYRPADIVKILAEGGIDRNGNGVIDTSIDSDNNGAIAAGEILPMADDNGNGIIDPGEIQDERVAWVARVGGAYGLGRSLCIGTDGNLWLGLYNSAAYYKVSAADGSVLAGPIATPGLNPYGCLVDGSGTLWSASLGNALGKLDTSTPMWVGTYLHQGGDYGIALGNGHVYQAEYASAYGFIDFDPATSTFSYPAKIRIGALGVAVDGNGDIFAGDYYSGGVVKFDKDGNVLWQRPAQAGTGEVRGVVVDSDNNVWLIHRTSDNLSKYRGSDGAALGVFPVGNQPYTYSDATGFALRNTTNKTGTWTVVVDAGANGADWSKVSWTDLLPAGTEVVVSVRADDSVANLPLEAYQPVTSGGDPNLQGRYLQVQARLTADAAGVTSPVLYDLTVENISGLPCDVDRDGDIDKRDTDLILRARGQTVQAGDPRDADGDRLVTVLDGKICIQRCTRPLCAVQ